MCWIHWALSRAPAQFARRCSAEVTDVLGDRLATAEEVHQLQYTSQVIDESLRLHSPIHSISRVAMEDNTVGGYHIPAGATVCMSMYAIHRLRALCIRIPKRSIPRASRPSRSRHASRFAYLPFAAGHRNCIGAGQALVELKLIVARIAQRFELDLAPGHKVEPAPGTTMFPRYGMKMRIRHVKARDLNAPAIHAANRRGSSTTPRPTTSTDFAFMNYGYAPLSAELAGTAEPEKYCLQLYRHLLGDADLRGKKVVEVSCGRGGGAAHVAATYQPRELPRHRHQREEP